MIDAADRREPRFPAGKEGSVADAIAALLDTADVSAGPNDLAICGGACGGDLLFAEACLARGTALEMYIGFDENTFLADSVDFANAGWRSRFLKARSRSILHVAPDELGPLPSGADPYERNNLWMLERAMRFGPAKLIFICLWNGEGGDGPGGTKHLMEEARRNSAPVYWLDIRKL
ncbi:hypothetical protein JQ628_23335 [Bradyrhizobium lablabi]|nr:hypothetical protein [Bradyrhizobium lablabi]MBR1124479.1 hypothetical protein [Bradyrhizobium lablabi]